MSSHVLRTYEQQSLHKVMRVGQRLMGLRGSGEGLRRREALSIPEATTENRLF